MPLEQRYAQRYRTCKSRPFATIDLSFTTSLALAIVAADTGVLAS